VFKQITIIGTGLIGGSLGLALKAAGFGGKIVGCDRRAVLDRARSMRAIDLGTEDPVEAVAGSDLIVLATPVGGIIDLIERIGPIAPPESLITDVGSTKKEILERARAVFGDKAAQRFIGGHPMAGKEHSGLENAESKLFMNAVWLLVPQAHQSTDRGKIKDYCELLERMGVRILKIEAERHDQICAWKPLAADDRHRSGCDAGKNWVTILTCMLLAAALREMTRIASSPYSMWRDIAHQRGER
jgi:prephenate dehydrogenase